MFSDANLPEPLVIREIENPVNLVKIGEKDNIGFNPRYTSVRLLRGYVYELIKKAREHLPPNYNFIIYEGYRPLRSQIELWEKVVAQKSAEYPHLDVNSEEFIALCDVFAANPYRQGSGHQSGAAVDISLVDDAGREYDMGGEVRGFGENADFDYPGISAEARKTATFCVRRWRRSVWSIIRPNGGTTLSEIVSGPALPVPSWPSLPSLICNFCALFQS